MKLNLSFSKIPFHYVCPVTVGKRRITSNTALRIETQNQNVDLTALPHFHHYTIDQWKFVLQDFFAERELNLNHFDYTRPAFGIIPTHFSGELLYAVEAVLFAHLSTEKYFPAPSNQIKINGLFSQELPFETVPDCVKIKIRPGKTAVALRAMSDCLLKNPDVLFRLDGNRTFEIETLLDFLRFCPLKSIQYIEEPFKNFSEIIAFNKMASIPVALDESLSAHFHHLQDFPGGYFILKPSLIGLSKCFEIATQFPHRTVISSSYETQSAMTALYSIAALLPEQFHGLDTIKFLPKELGK